MKIVTLCDHIVDLDKSKILSDGFGMFVGCPLDNGCSGTCDCELLEDRLIKSGTRVKVKRSNIIGMIVENDSDNSEVVSNVNYRVLPDGAKMGDSILCLPCEFTII